MKKNLLILTGIILILTSCNTEKKKDLYAAVTVTEKTNAIASTIINQDKEGYELLKNNCYVCHNPKAASHDDIIAPPFKAVKMHYSRNFDNKETFVNAIINWVQNPTEEKALMFGAVRRFNVMPKLNLPKEDLKKIATYLYNNEPESPNWMGNHMKGMQEKRGTQNGKGKGCGIKGNKSCGKNCNKNSKSCSKKGC